jgi:hypothetical protein
LTRTFNFELSSDMRLDFVIDLDSLMEYLVLKIKLPTVHLDLTTYARTTMQDRGVAVFTNEVAT